MSDRVKCENCEWKGRTDEGAEIDDIWERVEAGEVMPVCECPKCGSLCHFDNPKYKLKVEFRVDEDPVEKELEFDTVAEKTAFLNGVEAALGWWWYSVLEEDGVKVEHGRSASI